MRMLLALGAAAGIIAAGTTLAAARTGTRQQPAGKVTYDVACLGLTSLGKDINAEASQGWTVRAMVEHTTPTGQQCVLVLFEKAVP
jgi:hypothetical protein